MIFDRLLYPAVILMNKLPFKIKIITSVSLLFILLVLPFRNIFLDYFETNARLENKLIGLKYNNHIQEIIKNVQTHRGLSSGFFNGNEKFREDIILNEQHFDQKVEELIEFDSKHLKLLNKDKHFTEALGKFELIKIDSISKNLHAQDIFNKHINLISSLIKVLQNCARETQFDVSSDLGVLYIANMLQDKLLFLHEYTAQVRGIATGVFAKKEITKAKKKRLLSLYTLIQTLKSNLQENQMLKGLDNYAVIQKEITFASYKLDEVLYAINKDIILAQTPSLDSNLFFEQTTAVMREQIKLYRTLSQSYQNIVQNSKNRAKTELGFTVAGFFIIIFIALYVFVAFYRSVIQSLKKLERASQMIAQGKTDIQLDADTNDEIGDAILAFNVMSQELNQNISFLDGYKMAIDESSIVSKSDPKGNVTYVNKMFCELSGYSKDELIGQPHNIIRHPDMPKEVFKNLWETLKDKKIWHGIVKNRKKDGDYYIVDATIIPILDRDGNILEYVAVRHDVTELQKSKEEIQKQKTDPLTNLPNRNQLLEDLQNAKKPIMLYLNINDFANLNDFYGSKMGDQTLIYLASLLMEISRGVSCKSYRLNADEFVLLFEEGVVTRDNYKSAFEQIIEYLESKTIDCDKIGCASLTMSGGVSFYSLGEDNETLLTNTKMAHKIAKKGNKKFLLFENSMRKDDDYANNILWIKKIKEAIKESRVEVFFQPIIDNSSGAITKYESLVRIIDKEGKAISPFFFLEIAKKAKIYPKITKIVIDKTFEAFKNLPQYEFSINLAIEDMNNREITEYIYEKLKDYPSTDRIIFEITESEEIKDYKYINAFVKTVKRYGVKIAIDDFGSGYANFKYVLSLDADYIKIDGSIIKNIDTDEDSYIIAEAIIAFSKKLGYKTVAEYIHNEKVYEIVKALGADYSQGFYLGEPKPDIVSIESLLYEKIE